MLKLTREEWLTEASYFIIDDIMSDFLPEDFEPPKIRISVGFLSNKATKAIAVCYKKEASTDGTNEIFVTPTMDDTLQILGALTHELIHAMDNCESGHQHFFAKLARQVGLEGKLTATYAGEQLTAKLQDIIDTLGNIPHSKLDLTIAKKKQTTRMVKVTCNRCDFTFRTTKKHIENIDSAHTTCPACMSYATLIIENKGN